ncbi:plasmid partitioning/stability family protein [Enterobacter hormaechei]|uniref:plasmid partitioning/stability family protein n=1 Tax=Enterobacteriaceae TaxID=543 RepID=UPI000793ECC8|nr:MULTISPECIES: plasmid partitioning/stability family protein [Enterobacteriaceae]ELA2607714.1 plasmid partitioning/stability family protein [Klebsiella aerogenes]HBV4879277.1 plasmid partitioning/stability family protein [Klebsiella pneumoniae]HDC4311381.1 plasmid partitioning/stability family protein [Enterobacter kobei]MDI0409475.1 plasmid partitioning/stability family protein [Escherichia coli]CZW42388.1 Mediator of plasmid stability [Enterobacter hormaechei]
MHDGEERKKLSLYLHPEDTADRLALAEIESTPRKNRGELYRNALITGLIMHQLDERIPAIMTELFTRKLNVDEVINQISQITGWKPSVADIKDVLKALGGLQNTTSPEPSEDDGEKARLKAARTKMKNLI